MTTITVRNDIREHEIRAEGHATGSPEVCAGVSAVLYALAGWLENYGHKGDTVRLEPGDAELRSVSYDRDTQTAFSVAIIGLRQIAEGRGEFLTVRERLK